MTLWLAGTWIPNRAARVGLTEHSWSAIGQLASRSNLHHTLGRHGGRSSGSITPGVGRGSLFHCYWDNLSLLAVAESVLTLPSRILHATDSPDCIIYEGVFRGHAGTTWGYSGSRAASQVQDAPLVRVRTHIRQGTPWTWFPTSQFYSPRCRYSIV